MRPVDVEVQSDKDDGYNDYNGDNGDYEITEEPIMNMVEHNSKEVENFSSLTDDSDPEWRNGLYYSDEDVSSEDISDVIEGREDGFNEDNQEYYDSEIDMHKAPRIFHHGDGFKDPNGNIPTIATPIYNNGKITLRMWQSFEDYKAFGAVLKDYNLTCVVELSASGGAIVQEQHPGRVIVVPPQRQGW
ncbi:hypothetical protein PanWU01x14_240730 [Parasponia andersonii]|uniref:Uncharacterized protein n=1 Tax=Parasponia andersonii TaxID=3476 RepID=A0A2P5BGS5_PARAD|nr:hypothetical protein PanWU01x14_240730 [Parasponia andersonii]